MQFAALHKYGIEINVLAINLNELINVIISY